MSGGPFDAVAQAALASPSRWPEDICAVIESGTFDPPPWNVALGPVSPRGAPSGAVTREGRIAARWGDADRVDMAFSVTKSYIGLIAAAALDLGLIEAFEQPVSAAVDDPAFASPRNRAVTWRQLLDQTSEWEGTVFGIPDTVDRDRQLAPDDDPARFDRKTPLQAPGAYWDYNDARVNALCLALTRLHGRPLPDVLADLHPAFADRSAWRWEGYGDRSEIALDGRTVAVPVGGGHWGGGMAATARVHLALGGVVLGRGTFEGRRALSPEALGALLTPCPLKPIYGGLWWLNTDRRLLPAAPADSVLAMGVGATVVWAAPSLGIVACLRWVEPAAVGDVLAAATRAAGEG